MQLRTRIEYTSSGIASWAPLIVPLDACEAEAPRLSVRELEAPLPDIQELKAVYSELDCRSKNRIQKISQTQCKQEHTGDMHAVQ